MKKSKKEYQKEYRLKNREKIKEYRLKNKEYYQEYCLKNRERIKKNKKEYYLKNRERILEQKKKYYSTPETKEKMKEYKLKNKEHFKEWYLKNQEHREEYYKEYYLKNKEHYQERSKEYNSKPETRELRRNRVNNRYKTNINYRLTDLCRSRVYKALKGLDKSASTMELIGCTPDELRQHIESKFEPWMNWENQGRGGWDVDHIIACAKFDLTNPEQQKFCFHYTNLQPLEHIENIKKGAR